MKTLHSLLLLLCLTCVTPVAVAQASNPPEDQTCGLPKSGKIVATVTYTLKANCTQTGHLEIRTAETPSITLTIDGQGHTISNVSSNFNFLIVDDQGASTPQDNNVSASANVKVVIRDVTFDGNNLPFESHRYCTADNSCYWSGFGSWILAEGSLTMENVTFTGGNGIWLTAKGTATLNNVLFENSTIWNWGISSHIKGALHVTGTGNVTLNNAVFRDIKRSVIAVEKGGRLTTTGCLSFIRTFTHNVHHSGVDSKLFGAWSDSSTGPCSSGMSIGNGGQAVVAYSPALLACGLPADAVIDEDSVYTLNQDCVCLKTLTVSPGVTVTINGNGYRIVGCDGPQFTVASRFHYGAAFLVGGEAHLKITRARIFGIQTWNYGGAFTLGKSTVAQTSPTPILNFGFAHIYESTFEGNQSSDDETEGSVYRGFPTFRLGHALFRDNLFSRNSASVTELYTRGGGTWISLCGENQREDPIDDPGDDVTPGDNVFLLPLWLAIDGGNILQCPGNISHNSSPCHRQQRLGAIGLICHLDQEPAGIEILEVSRQSEGRRILRVMQSEIDRIDAGPVACSADGRAAVRVGLTGPVGQEMVHTRAWRDTGPQRVIQVSMGPTVEDKVHHVVINQGLDGHVLGTVDTRPDIAPCPASALSTEGSDNAPDPVPVYAPPVFPQQPRADGSIIHVVRTGDTVWAIGVAYNVHPHVIIERNSLGWRGRFIFPGQELLIREANG